MGQVGIRRTPDSACRDKIKSTYNRISKGPVLLSCRQPSIHRYLQVKDIANKRRIAYYLFHKLEIHGAYEHCNIG